MTREDEIEIARRFTEWIEYTASLYLTEENDVLSVIGRVLSKIDEEGYDIAKEILKELVIKIPEDSYKAACSGSMLPPDVKIVINAIKNGTPLPKEHGDLIDRGKLRKHERDVNDGSATWLMDIYLPEEIDNAPIIIEANKESE